MALRRAFLLGIVLALAGCAVTRRASAQFIGYISHQSTTSTPYNAVTCTAALAASPVKVSNIGQAAHVATYIPSGSPPQQLVYTIQASFDGSTFFDISDPGTGTANTGPLTTSLSATNYYPVIAVRVQACAPASATLTIQYSGISLTPGSNSGTALQGQISKNIALNSPSNTSLSPVFVTPLRTPFGMAAGFLQFVFTGAAGPGGSSISISCGANSLSLPYVFGPFSLQTTQSLAQSFPIPPVPCAYFNATYTSGGASSAVFQFDYLFSPETPAAAFLPTHITGATATAVKATGGLLHTLTVNTGAAGTVSIFDLATASCTGTPATNTQAIITATATTLQTFTYDANFLNGICVKASVAMDLTVTAQ